MWKRRTFVALSDKGKSEDESEWEEKLMKMDKKLRKFKNVIFAIIL